MSSWVPEGWVKRTLDEVSHTSFSNVDKKSHADELPVLLCNYMDVYANSQITSDLDFMAATAKQREIDKFSLEFDDVMITKDSETPEDIAVPAHVSAPLKGVICGYHLALIRTDKRQLDGEFLSHLLSLDAVQRRFYRLANGSTRFGLTAESINKAELIFPPLPEQKKIASILTSVDEVIENTQKQIDKLQDLKKATMNELLTKGIGHTEFKDSELGRIPDVWESVPLGEIAKVYSGGTPSRNDPSNYDGNIPWVKSGELNAKRVLVTEEKISEKALETSSAKWVEAGSVLIAMYGATAGTVALLGLRATINQAISAVCAYPNKTCNSFIFYALEFRSRELLDSLQGGAQPNLTGQIIKELRIALPLIDEQEQIAKVLASIDEKILNSVTKKDKFVALKKALMQDLLSGKVRVSVD